MTQSRIPFGDARTEMAEGWHHTNVFIRNLPQDFALLLEVQFGDGAQDVSLFLQDTQPKMGVETPGKFSLFDLESCNSCN